jgi:hypothetical protein
MTMSTTLTRSNTFSEARARDVMLEVGADFYAVAAAGLISWDDAQKWTEEISFILIHQAAIRFQIQLQCQGYAPRALDYRVSADGSVLESGTAGGINYFALPPGTRATLYVEWNSYARDFVMVQQYLYARGWTPASAVDGAMARDRVYSKDQYGVVRSKVGTWP